MVLCFLALRRPLGTRGVGPGHLAAVRGHVLRRRWRLRLRQDDVRGWTRLFARAGFFVEEQEVYELTEAGWRAAPELDPAGVRYGARGPAASAVLCAELSPRRLRRLLTPSGLEATARRRAPRSLRRLRRLPRSG